MRFPSYRLSFVCLAALVEEISLALKDEFKVHLQDLIPHFLTILHADRTERREPTLKVEEKNGMRVVWLHLTGVDSTLTFFKSRHFFETLRFFLANALLVCQFTFRLEIRKGALFVMSKL